MRLVLAGACADSPKCRGLCGSSDDSDPESGTQYPILLPGVDVQMGMTRAHL